MTFLDARLVVGMLFLALVLSVEIFSLTKTKKSKSRYLFYVAIVTLPFIIANADKNDALENVKLMQDGNALKCTVNSTLYKVSQAEGWSVKNDIYFMKDSLLIRADRCKRL